MHVLCMNEHQETLIFFMESRAASFLLCIVGMAINSIVPTSTSSFFCHEIFHFPLTQMN